MRLKERGHLRSKLNAERFQRGLISLGLIALVLLQNVNAFAWGNEGHVAINRVAAQKIPATMPRFLRRAVVEVAYLGPEPDRWRSPSEFALKNSQEPDHFIDLERVSWLDPLPPGRYEFYRKLYDKRASTTDHPDDYLPERVGLQPYITMEVYGRLKAAFREYRQRLASHQPTHAVQQAIIFYAGWLGHYVADGSQPLHTTINYDGWVEANPRGFTTQKGIHWRFETDFVNRNISASDFAALVGPPQQLMDPFHDYVKYLWTSHYYVPQVYEIDKAGGFDGAGTPESLKFTQQRMAAGAQMLLDLWYTAWLQSAQPEPEPAGRSAN